MKTEIILQILTILTVIIVGIVIIIKNKRSSTKLLMITLVNSIFEDINNPQIEHLRCHMPIRRRKDENYFYFIDKTQLFDPKKEYCNPYYLKNGYTLKVSTGHYEGSYAIEVSLQQRSRLIYSKIRKI